MAAITEGRTEIARMLIEKGADVNAKMAFGLTPLLGAAVADDAAMVQLLLDKGADANAKAIMDKTPSWAAARKPCGCCSQKSPM